MGRVTHMVDGGFYGYPFDFIPQRPYTLWMMADYGAGAATGATVATSDALPEAWRGNLFLADFGQRNIRRVPLLREGGSFKPGPDENLFPDPPGDFRPVGIAFNDQGNSLYICDWQHRDSREEAVAGRLWRLTWTGDSKPATRPGWYRSAALGQSIQVPAAELLPALAHPAHSVRLTAQRQLARLGPSILPLLTAHIASNSIPSPARIHALWAAHALDSGTASRIAILDAARSSDLRLARQAIRQLGEARALSAAPILRPLLKSTDASIRFTTATALGRITDPDSIPDLLEALAQEDLFPRFAAFTALQRIGRAQPVTWPRIVAGLRHQETRIREGTRHALRDVFDLQLVEALTQSFHDPQASDFTRRAALETLGSLHHQPIPWNGEWWAYHPFRMAPPARTRAWAGTIPAVDCLLAALSHPDPSLRQIAATHLGNVPGTAPGTALLQRYQVESDPSVRSQLVQSLIRTRPPGTDTLVVQWLDSGPIGSPWPVDLLQLARAIGGAPVIQSLQSTFNRAATGPRVRQAVELLGQLGDPSSAAFLDHLRRQGPSELHPMILAALGQLGGSVAEQALIDSAGQGPITLRNAALTALAPLRSSNAVPVLLHAWSDPTLRPVATQALLQIPDPRALDVYLDALASRQSSVRADARRVFGRIRDVLLPALPPRFKTLPPSVIGELQQIYRAHPDAAVTGLMDLESQRPDRETFLAFALAQPGDSARGKILFDDPAGVGCITCHRVQGSGAHIGPDLSGVGAQFDRRALAESILWPSRAVREGYNLVEIELVDGDELTGMIRGETADSLSLQPPSGDLIQIPRTRIKTRRQTSLSLMPEGLEGSLSLEDFSDLLAYLESLRSGT
jgi:putative heme-binding domain-containing protein